MDDMRRYWHILRKYKISLALCPILVLITVWCETIQPMYMAEIVDQGVMKRDLSLIAEKGVYMILISLSGLRSEERRVGKECRTRWSPYH